MNRITQGMDQEEMSVMEQETRFALFQQNPDCKIAVQKKINAEHESNVRVPHDVEDGVNRCTT